MVALKRRVGWLSGPELAQGSRNAVVALKLPQHGSRRRITPGSRNAVVALKPRIGSRRNWRRARRKQERRGGIETELVEGREGPEGQRKQERRGGIETASRLQFR